MSWARAGPLASGTQLWVSGGWGAQQGAVTGRAQGGRRNFKGELGRSRLGHFSSAGQVATPLPRNLGVTAPSAQSPQPGEQ